MSGSRVTAAERVADKDAYRFNMDGGFVPMRRDVAWLDTKVAAIQPLLKQLEFTQGKRNWGYVFRFGVVKISEHDRDVILEVMGAS